MASLLRLALPILLSSVLSAINHLVDRFFLAQAGDIALAAVLPAGMLGCLLTVLGSMAIGYSETFIAQDLGGGRKDEAVRDFAQGLHLTIAALPIFLLACPLGCLVLDLVGHEDSVRAAEKTYFLFIQPGGILLVLSTVLGGLFTGQGKTRFVSFCSALAALANVFFDWLLITGCGPLPAMGITGAGLATVLANAVPCLLLTLALLREPLLKGCFRNGLFAPRPARAFRILRFGFPNGINSLIGAGTFTVFTFALGKRGADALAASNAVLSLNNVHCLAEAALAQALTIAAARAYGSGGAPAVRAVLKNGLILSLLAAGLFLAGLVPFADFWLGLFTTDQTPPLFLSIGRNLIYILIFRALADAIMTGYFGTLRGIGDTRFLMAMRTGLDILLWMPLIFLTLRYKPTIEALWLTVPIILTLSAATLAFRYHRGTWRAIS